MSDCGFNYKSGQCFYDYEPCEKSWGGDCEDLFCQYCHAVMAGWDDVAEEIFNRMDNAVVKEM